MSAPLAFTIERVLNVPTATIKMTVATPPAGIASSQVSVVETLADGTVLSPANYTFDYTVPAPVLSQTFTSGLGSTLVATQVDTNAGGFQSPPTVNPPFVVANPQPPAPAPLTLEVVGINP
jgi:hypothetical protein